MSILSPSQRLILMTAAERADGAVLPLPEALARRGRAMMLKSLLARGLVMARAAHPDEPVWSAGGDAPGQALAITPEGRAALDTVRLPAPRTARRRKTSGRRQPRAAVAGPPAALRPGTKQALLIDLLNRPEGASIAEIQAATGWLPHSARAALTGLRHKGFTLTSARRQDGSRAYHGAPAEADAPDQAG